jgi:hypothetical protein
VMPAHRGAHDDVEVAMPVVAHASMVAHARAVTTAGPVRQAP